ncbi:dehydrogenase/reductase SDR family member 13-like [Thamnophis elegans]|uniref:dehydrogenase/reductase SDR family member 13-like n=1 Tax=Thamnophis elegans TaxID=35005 RepID=UPI0013788876|nr:dehydrogenase/reductase SDR family member 13-like [Thamnophis elegans]
MPGGDQADAEGFLPLLFQESGNSEVILMILDLGSLDSVRAFAQTFLESEPRLDILINNAGVFQGGQTADGFDQAFQVNHLAHFLLTHLLLDRLKRCAPSRIVTVVSSIHVLGKIDFRTIHRPVEGMWQALHSYSNSKLANVLQVRELANRLEGTDVTCYAVHPGKWKSGSKALQIEPPPRIPMGAPLTSYADHPGSFLHQAQLRRENVSHHPRSRILES